MLKQFFLICTLTVFTANLFAQAKFLGKPIKSFTITGTYDQDFLGTMNKDYFLGMMSDPSKAEQFDFDVANEDKWAGICENPNFGFAITMDLPRNFELGLGVNAIFDRVDGLSYYKDDWASGNYEYLNFSTYSDEVSLTASFTKRLGLVPFKNRLGNSPINLYLGIGTNTGVIFDHYMYVYGSTVTTVVDYGAGQEDELKDEVIDNDGYEYFSESAALKNGFTQRIYAEAGLGFTLIRRLEVGIVSRYGYGYRVVGGHTNTTNLQTVGFSVKWLVN